MNIKKTYLLLSAALLAACSGEIDPEALRRDNPIFGNGTEEPVALTFSIGEQHDFTRSATEVMKFDAAATVKVFARPQGDDAYTQYDYKTAAEGQAVGLTLDKNYATGDATPPYFPAGIGTSVDVYAYHPATAGPTGDATSVTFSVQDTQTDEAAYKASDLMYCARTFTKASAVEVQNEVLTMAHQMARLKIQAKSDGFTVKRVVLQAYKSVTFKPGDATAVVTTTGSQGDIVVYDNTTGVYDTGDQYVMIPSQQIKDTRIVVETGTPDEDDSKATFVFTSTSLYESGSSYGLSLTIDATRLGVSTVIADWNGNESVTYVPSGDLTVEAINAVDFTGKAHVDTESDATGEVSKDLTVTVKNGSGATLTKGTDYTLEFINNTNAGTGIVLVKGTGSYDGQAGIGLFNIRPLNLASQVAISEIPEETYNRAAHTPALSITDNVTSAALQVNLDYTVEYVNNTNAGTATCKIIGKGNYAGSSTTKDFTISPKSISSMTVTPTFTSTPFTGSTITNSVTSVTDGSYTLNAGTEYTVGGTTSATNAATSASAGVTTNTMTVTGTGNYTGTKDVTWTISRIAPSLSLSPTSLTLTKSDATKNITVTHNGGGTISASSSATDVASVGTISGTSVPVTGKANGSATITVNVAQSQNYSSDSKTVSVTCSGFTDVTMNPLWYVAQYNMTSATAMASTDNAGYFFNWSTAMSNFAAQSASYDDYKTASKSVGGVNYHLPVQAEWWSIVPGANTNIWDYVSSSSTTAYKSAYITPKWGYNSTTKAGVSESSWFKYVSATELHAIRFLGTDYCSAWKWVWSGSTLTISATLIGSVANSESAASSWYSSNWSSVTWGNNDSKGAVQRSFYARGFAYSSNLSGGTASSASNDAGSAGHYWSATESNSNQAWRLYFGSAFGSGYAYVSNYGKANGFSVRLFRDN